MPCKAPVYKQARPSTPGRLGLCSILPSVRVIDLRFSVHLHIRFLGGRLSEEAYCCLLFSQSVLHSWVPRQLRQQPGDRVRCRVMPGKEQVDEIVCQVIQREGAVLPVKFQIQILGQRWAGGARIPIPPACKVALSQGMWSCGLSMPIPEIYLKVNIASSHTSHQPSAADLRFSFPSTPR